jgi:hypothetical protein
MRPTPWRAKLGGTAALYTTPGDDSHHNDRLGSPPSETAPQENRQPRPKPRRAGTRQFG